MAPSTPLTGSPPGHDRFAYAAKRESFKVQALLIAGFLLRYPLGAVSAKWVGLSVVVFPGMLLVQRFSRTAPVTV